MALSLEKALIGLQTIHRRYASIFSGNNLVSSIILDIYTIFYQCFVASVCSVTPAHAYLAGSLCHARRAWRTYDLFVLQQCACGMRPESRM